MMKSFSVLTARLLSPLSRIWKNEYAHDIGMPRLPTPHVNERKSAGVPGPMDSETSDGEIEITATGEKQSSLTAPMISHCPRTSLDMLFALLSEREISHGLDPNRQNIESLNLNTLLNGCLGKCASSVMGRFFTSYRQGSWNP